MPVTVLRPVVRLFDQQKNLLIDLTNYIDYCDLTSTVYYANTLAGHQAAMHQDYRLSITGYECEKDVRDRLSEMQCRFSEWCWFEYSQIWQEQKQNYFVGKAYVRSFSLPTSYPAGISKWALELVCSDVQRGRIQEEERQKSVLVTKQGRRIAREG